MTTNQTIDGVPRELLSEWLKALNSRTSVPVAIRKMRNELRALLDAPAPCSHEWTDDGEFTLTCTKCGTTENHEPYGWVQTRGDAINHFTQEWDVVESWEDRGFEYKAMFDRVEQPAPVAVKHTMRSIMEAVERSSEYTVLTSNQCAALAAALNTTRPAHANPPPGAEPSGTHRDNDGLDDWRKS